jgi:hypothetical protein
MMILNRFLNMNGMDRIGHRYLVQALDMARDLKIFEAKWSFESEKKRKVRIITAWSLFSWQVVCSFYFFQPPFLENPPEDPLPNPTACSHWYGETWLQYPGDQELTPTYLGCVFKERAALRVIMNDLAKHLYGQMGYQRKISRDQLLRLKSTLGSWFTELPDVLAPNKIVLPVQFELQSVSLHLIWLRF